MGNCQAVDAAALVIQHPSGKIEKMYWSVTASQIMKMNPGHYVSLIIPIPGVENHDNSGNKTIRFTRVKLLRPSDNLALGRAYHLVTSHEVMKVLRAKRQANKKEQLETSVGDKEISSELENSRQVMTHERTIRQKSGSFSKSRSWRPSLQSISEAAS